MMRVDPTPDDMLCQRNVLFCQGLALADNIASFCGLTLTD
jgi:hypothetical protein